MIARCCGRLTAACLGSDRLATSPAAKMWVWPMHCSVCSTRRKPALSAITSNAYEPGSRAAHSTVPRLGGWAEKTAQLAGAQHIRQTMQHASCRCRRAAVHEARQADTHPAAGQSASATQAQQPAWSTGTRQRQPPRPQPAAGAPAARLSRGRPRAAPRLAPAQYRGQLRVRPGKAETQLEQAGTWRRRLCLQLQAPLVHLSVTWASSQSSTSRATKQPVMSLAGTCFVNCFHFISLSVETARSSGDDWHSSTTQQTQGLPAWLSGTSA